MEYVTEVEGMKWVGVKKCVICGGNNFEKHKNVIQKIRFPTEMSIFYYLCNDCGLIFQNPHMDEDSLHRYYFSEKYRQSILTPQEHMDASELLRQKRIAKYVPVGSHLDVGCSRGYMLQITREKGCDVWGVEPNEKYVLPDVPFSRSIDEVDRKFDTVTCIHVLEHILEPQGLVNKLIEKTISRLIIEVPGEENEGYRLPHLYHFSTDIILRMCDGMILEEHVPKPNNTFMFRKI
jgi:hypothetical protein